MTIKTKRRNYIIIGLCAILVIMAVGYAAFSSLLTINGTATANNSWCLGFDQTKTNTYTITKGVQTGTSPTGSMSYSGTACQTNYVPTASLSSVFYQPGDQVEYTLTIKNSSSVGAAIKSILIDNTSVTSNTTITKGNIQYIVEMPASTTLAANAETTMKVTAKFQNDTDISGAYASGETQTVQVKINAEQDDGTGGMATGYTGSIYRWSTTYLTNKGSADASSYPYTIINLTKGTDYITEDDYSTPSARATALGHNYYIKHDIVNDEIINSYLCFISGTEYCLQGGDNGASFETNTQLIQSYQIYQGLETKSNASSSNPGCKYDSGQSACYGSDFKSIWTGESSWMVPAPKGGVTIVDLSNSECNISASSGGRSRCIS